ncbi:MAG: alpha/beta fold hydrolase, partial [Pseudomonadota bacterium]
MAGSRRKVTFEGALGDQLSAALELPPAGQPLAYALFAHCFSCSKEVFAARRVSEGLARLGIAVLRFDFTGLGQSDGDFANTNFSSNVEDLVKAADFLRRSYEAPRLLVGHSLGGAAVILAAGRIPEVAAVATIGAPSDVEHVALNFG